MLQSVLIFTLGFLAAALLALIAAPAIWRRAVYLTRKRIEAALPLTINELNAEKDALRAEHAMAMRRIELRLKDTREFGTSEKLLVETQADRIKALEKELAETSARKLELERQTAELRDRLDERVTELSEASVWLESTRSELDVRGSELKAATQLREDRAGELEAMRGKLADRDAQIESLYETIGELKAARQDLKREVHESNADGQTVGDALMSERKRVATAEAKLGKAVADIAALEEKLEEREAELKSVRAHDSDTDVELRQMEERVAAAEAAKTELERQLQEMSSRLERMAGTFGDGGPEAMIADLQDKLAHRATEIASLETERDALKVELAAASFGSAAGLVDGDTILRDKLNELAAEVVAMAARLEGPESPIPALLEGEGGAARGKVVSLAERIKALQAATNGKRNSA